MTLNSKSTSLLSTTTPLNKLNKLRLVQKILFIYVVIILFILSCALLNFIYPSVMGRIFRDEVGLVAFICLVTIQGSLEMENKTNIKNGNSQFFFKFVVYLLDLVLVINCRIRSSFVIFGCLFTLIQLCLLYLSILKYHYGKATKTSQGSAGMTLICANILALAFIIGKDFLPEGFSTEGIKISMISGVMMFYVKVMLAKKMYKIMEKIEVAEEQNVLFRGFKIIRPLVSSVIGKFNKVSKLKIK